MLGDIFEKNLYLLPIIVENLNVNMLMQPVISYKELIKIWVYKIWIHVLY